MPRESQLTLMPQRLHAELFPYRLGGEVTWEFR